MALYRFLSSKTATIAIAIMTSIAASIEYSNTSDAVAAVTGLLVGVTVAVDVGLTTIAAASA